MGISGLLPLLKSIHRPADLKKYAGETLGVDGYGWLHRGAISCAMELAQGKPTRKYVDFAMHRVRMFKHFGVTPYLVFDGDYLPSKAGTESSRESRRDASRSAGLELLRAGKPAQAYQELQKAIDVTPEMARHLIEDLKKANIPYVVAPYEADAQLVYLERQGTISGIVTEDSDLLVFGAKRLLTKMDEHGQCIEINRKDFCLVRNVSLTGWTDVEFRHMAIFSGCDYLGGLKGMGLKTAHRMIRQHKTPERVIKRLQFDGKEVPDNYLADFKQAELTFVYQRVFCPKKRDIVFLTEPDPTVDVEAMPFIGAPVETKLARAIAVGDVNPITKKSIVVPLSPGKRRISQVSAPVQVAKKPLGKPINEYFGSRRIPLGEMDPNCFATKPHENNGTPAEEPRPIVFPLPRPYLDDAGSTTGPTRSYTNRTQRRRTIPIAEQLINLGEITSQNRRHTAGPTIQIYQDSSSSARPPKKARLCEDLPVDLPVKCTPERSRFFASKPKKATSKPADQFLMSDDSIDEVFRNLPDFGSRPPAKPARISDVVVHILDDSPRRNPDGLSMGDDDTVVSDDVEVPASSPLAPPPPRPTAGKRVSSTPLGARLQQFSYSTVQQPTRIVHGLPTPSSSTERPSSTPRSTSWTGGQTPRLTPLQRIGAQALQRDRTRPTPASSRPSSSAKRGRQSSHNVNPALVPLPEVDLQEVEALNRAVGSEDQIIPESDGENDLEDFEGLTDRERRLVRPTLWVRCLLAVNKAPMDRLRDHAKAFDGLLSLIPAKMYYGADEKNYQWMKKKQTKDQARAAKRGKLDPDSELNRSAKEELEERARNKRKLRELEAEDDDSEDDEDSDMSVLAGVEKEKPLEGLKVKKTKEPASEEDGPSPKKVKVDEEDAAADVTVTTATPNKKLTKEERKSAKKQKVAEEEQAEEHVTTAPTSKKMSKEERKSAKKAKKEEKLKAKLEQTPAKADAAPEVADAMDFDEADIDDDMVPIDVSGLVADAGGGAAADSTEDSTPSSPTFDGNNNTKNPTGDAASISTSISSAVPPSEKPKYIKLPVDTTALRARLEARIETMRAQRKAKSEEGQQIRTRAELIESRREKQIQRPKEEEDRKREEALTSSRNSPMSMLSPMFNDPDDGRNANHFAFGRLAFSDGTQMSHDLSYQKSAEKKKGPLDPKSALAKIEAQKKRLAGLDDDKRKEVLEKETWLAARRRAEGEKVHDNETLLKKAVKRKEKTKKKSEKEWKERKQSVEKGIKDRQRKREENLRKRRDEKGGKGKKKGGPTKPKNRPGFEGGGFGGGKRK
ncbi:hypothetical protein B0T16DRAFT_428237 [Cercophora newfieldiana]|uniref:Exonuclease 1 n=1 Tax=Cercophora newfieldiana TaxID=92897 RepID=A0AA40CSE1_9PEZI|nr:hypothetical protein B0T16DRAFT_428237 [Cercophora newfieldiana]